VNNNTGIGKNEKRNTQMKTKAGQLKNGTVDLLNPATGFRPEFNDTPPVRVTTSPLSRGGKATASDDDKKAARGLVAAFSDAFARRDAHAFSMVFHHGADFTNVWGVTAQGRLAIEEFHRPLLEGDGAGAIPSFKNAEFKILETRIRFLRPDVASVDATWTQTGAVQHGHDMGVRKGLLMLIVTRELEGWGIASMHNMDLASEK
jgi:uncharacterized protein (TIGR02246 family)